MYRISITETFHFRARLCARWIGIYEVFYEKLLNIAFVLNNDFLNFFLGIN